MVKKTKEDITTMLDQQAKQREQTQAQLTAVATGKVQERKAQRNLRKDENGAQIKLTLSITNEDKERVKMFAIKNRTTVSDLLHEWITQFCD